MSLISYGNACNMSAQWRARVRRRIERNKDRIESTRLGYASRHKLRNEHHYKLDELMEDLYLFSCKRGNIENGLSYFNEVLNELHSEIKNEISMYDKDSILLNRLSGIEKMVVSIERTVQLSSDSPRLDNYISKSIPELFVSYMNKVNGKFGDEIYKKLRIQ